MPGKVYHISGHLDLTKQEFIDHYARAIDQACEEDAAFVVGDARGADQMAQVYIRDNHWRADLTVFHMFGSPRFNENDSPTSGGFQSDEERDMAMTRASTHDICWVRPGRENSGTANNLKRRQELAS